MRRSTVLLADDHTIVQEGLARLLEANDFEVVGAVGDGELLIDAAKRLRPDAIVTDLSMPGLSGLDVLARLKAEGVDSKVIVLTMHNDANLATIALRGGAAGYLLKESAGEELLAAIRQALQGRVYLTPALTKEVMERMASPDGPAQAATHATPARCAASDREGSAHEGDRGEPGLVDTDGRDAQVRDDGDPGDPFHGRARAVCARPPAQSGLTERSSEKALAAMRYNRRAVAR